MQGLVLQAIQYAAQRQWHTEPMLVTESPMVTDSRDEQPLKAFCGTRRNPAVPTTLSAT